MSDHFWKELPAILAITFIFGGVFIVGLAEVLTRNWRRAKEAEQNAVLKKAMIDKGFSPEQIVKVIESGTPPAEDDD